MGHNKANYEVMIMKGTEVLAEGTIDECAEKLGVGRKTIKFYLTPAYQRRLAKRKNLDNSRMAVRLDDEDDEL